MTVGNVHQNSAGGIKRAKEFLCQFGWMVGNTVNVPQFGGIVNDSTRVIADAAGGNTFRPFFGFNPGYKQLGAPSNLTPAVRFTYADNPATNVAANVYPVADGLRADFSATGALPGRNGAVGTAATLQNNSIEIGNRWGRARWMDMSVYGPGKLFQAYDQITIVDPTNLGSIRPYISTGTSPGFEDGTHRKYFYPTFPAIPGAWDLPGCLEAGDVLTLASPVFGFGNNQHLLGHSCLVYLAEMLSAGQGPSLVFNNKQIVELERTTWAG
jgi:hypothetical protein